MLAHYCERLTEDKGEWYRINMKHIVQFTISKGEKFYVAEGINFPAVTQGKTLDELVKNITEAVELGLEGENLVMIK